MPVRTLALSVPVGDAELAADRLWVAGARAVEECDAESGRVELRTVLAADDDRSLDRLGALRPGWRVRFVDVPDEPAGTWRRHARPIRISDDLVLRPAWCRPTGAPCEVVIEPGAAFGLGDHPTTILGARAVHRLVQPGDQVLDVGCGTGVLAIVALRDGAARAVAIDVSQAAVEVTLANAAANGVGERIDAAATPIDAVDGRFDLVVANILAPALVAMADELRRLTAPGGSLVISGVLADAHDHVLTALSPMIVRATEVRDGWAAVELAHPQRSSN